MSKLNVDTSNWVKGKNFPNWMDEIGTSIISQGYLLPHEDVFKAFHRVSKAASRRLKRKDLQSFFFEIILDFVGLSQIHGYPDDHREWSLNGDVKRRSKPKKEDDDGIARLQTCPECFKAHEPAPACPKCGHEYTAKEARDIRVVEGDLVKIERQQKIDQAQAADVAKTGRRLEEVNCKTMDDWINLAKQRDYRFPVAWATTRYELRCRRKPIPATTAHESGTTGDE